MIMRLTKLFVADNTGAKVAMCIGIRGRPHLTAGVGRIIKVVVKEMRPLSEVAMNKEAAALSAISNQRIIDTTSTATIAATMSNGINKGAARGNWKVVPGKVYNALIIRTRNRIQREDGRVLRFDDNACIIMSGGGERGHKALREMKPIGTRVSGPVPLELRRWNWLKALTLSSRII